MARLRLFANLRETAGTGQADFDGATVGEVLDAAKVAYGKDFARGLTIAKVWVNGEPAQANDAVTSTDEIALIPPVSGGALATRAMDGSGALLVVALLAALVVAGGQGSRLGFEGPKGVFPIGPVTDRTLFEIQAQKIRGLRRRYERPLPWCVMTSAATDAATREFFRKAEFFGLPEEDVVFFRQGMVPSMDFEGRLFLEARDRIDGDFIVH